MKFNDFSCDALKTLAYIYIYVCVCVFQESSDFDTGDTNSRYSDSSSAATVSSQEKFQEVSSIGTFNQYHQMKFDDFGCPKQCGINGCVFFSNSFFINRIY